MDWNIDLPHSTGLLETESTFELDQTIMSQRMCKTTCVKIVIIGHIDDKCYDRIAISE